MFTLEGEPSPANLALAVMEVDQEAEHIAKTPLEVIPAPAPKGEARGADKGPAEPLVRPNHPGGPSASWLISMTGRARFTGEGSPLRANVDEASLNGLIALPAMGNDQSCGGDESKKIKMEVRKKGGG